MNFNLAHKIRIYPNHKQEEIFAKACGTSRFTYNWALNRYNELYNSGEKPSILQIKKEWNSIKPEWVYEAPKDANQQPFTNLQSAFGRFFKKTSKYPTFKKKGQRDSFYISNDKFHVNAKYVRLPKIGSVKMAEAIRFKGKIMSATISRISSYWFISFSVVLEDTTQRPCGTEIVGVDLGLKTYATCSNGDVYHSPRPLKCKTNKLKALSRRHSKKVIGSKNRDKSKRKLSRLHYKISCQRQDFIHKTTTSLCSKAKTIVIEDLNVSGMMANHKLARAISDVGFYEFRRQLEYKSKIYGVNLIIAHMWFPSSKLCSNCGCIREDLTLNDRVYECSCGLVIDRDLNASFNLCTLGYRGI